MLTLTMALCPFRPSVLCILRVFRLAGLRWVSVCEMALERVCVSLCVCVSTEKKNPPNAGGQVSGTGRSR